jgi:hypothetical protein
MPVYTAVLISEFTIVQACAITAFNIASAMFPKPGVPLNKLIILSYMVIIVLRHAEISTGRGIFLWMVPRLSL